MLPAELDDRADVVRVEGGDEDAACRLELAVERPGTVGIPTRAQRSAQRESSMRMRGEGALRVCRTQHRPVDGGGKLFKENVREGRWRYGERQVRSRWLDGCHRRGWGSRWRLRSVMRGRIERS